MWRSIGCLLDPEGNGKSEIPLVKNNSTTVEIYYVSTEYCRCSNYSSWAIVTCRNYSDDEQSQRIVSGALVMSASPFDSPARPAPRRIPARRPCGPKRPQARSPAARLGRWRTSGGMDSRRTRGVRVRTAELSALTRTMGAIWSGKIPGNSGRLPVRSFRTRNQSRIAAWPLVRL